MYNIMIVDDEPFVRLALKSLTDWREKGFKFEYEASNGKEALNIINKKNDVDIIILDMNMPVMHGLEFIEKIKIINDDIPIIVLSGFNDYNLVRKSFKLGIVDYILKMEMNADKILSLLYEATKRIISKKSKNDSGENKVIKNLFLQDLLSSQNNDIILQDEFNRLGIKLYSNNIRLIFLWIDDFFKIKERYKDNSLNLFIKSIKNAINQIITARECGELISISPQEYILFFSFSRKMISKEKIIDLIEEIKHSLKNYLNVEVSIGISNFSEDYKNINLLYTESEKCAKYRYITGKNSNIFYDDFIKICEENKNNIKINTELLSSLLKNHDYEKANIEFLKLINELSNFKPETIDKIYDYYLRFVFILTDHLFELNEDVIDIFDKDICFYEEITKLESISEINNWVKNIFDKICSYLNEKRKSFYSRPIIKSLKYIKCNFYKNDLTLKTISDHVELSSAHFSHLFVKETGENFTEYLTRQRINKAKNLLKETNMKVYEVCYAVGYDNVEHFSRIFKKITGVSPNLFNKI